MKQLLTIGLVTITLLSLSACMLNSNTAIQTFTNINNSTTTPNTTVFIDNITIGAEGVKQISSANILMGATEQFIATGTYSDESTTDITSQVTWGSSNTSIAVINSSGLATGITVGNTNITANFQGITKSISFTVASNSPIGTFGNYYIGLVNTSEGDLGGDGCYDDTGDFIILINNKNATNPTYSQLVSFLQSDTIDEYPYLPTSKTLSWYYGTPESNVDLTRIQNIIDGTAQPSNPEVCGDFAERLHNDAEMASIRCAYVSIGLSTGGHAIDAFQTTDDGLVYVDDTGWVATSPHPYRAVNIADPIVGQQYITTALFPEDGWENSTQSMGTITSVEVIWDGVWN